MDNSSGRAAQGQITQGQGTADEASAMPNAANTTSFDNGLRQRTVNKLMEFLKRRFPFSGEEGLQDLEMVAIRIEERVYYLATNKSDYLRRLFVVMCTPAGIRFIKHMISSTAKRKRDVANVENVETPTATLLEDHKVDSVEEKLTGPALLHPVVNRTGEESVQDLEPLRKQRQRKSSVANMIKRSRSKRKWDDAKASGVDSVGVQVTGSPMMPPVVDTTSKRSWQQQWKESMGTDPSGGGKAESLAVEGPVYVPEWSLRTTDRVNSAEQAKQFFFHGILPMDNSDAASLSHAAVFNNLMLLRYQTLVLETELAKRTEALLGDNHNVQRVEIDLKKTKEEMEAAKKRVIELEGELETLKKCHEEDKVTWLSWKSEVERLQQKYEDSEGQMNAATIKGALSIALKDESFGWMFNRLARPIVGDTCYELAKVLQDADPTFKLPPEFQELADEAETAVQPWQGGAFDIDELLAPPDDDEEENNDDAAEDGDVVQDGIASVPNDWNSTAPEG